MFFWCWQEGGVWYVIKWDVVTQSPQQLISLDMILSGYVSKVVYILQKNNMHILTWSQYMSSTPYVKVALDPKYVIVQGNTCPTLLYSDTALVNDPRRRRKRYYKSISSADVL